MYYLLIWQKIGPWKHAEEENDELNQDYLEEFSTFGQDFLPISEINYSSYEQDASRLFDCFFNELTMEYCCNLCSFKSKYRHNTIRHLHSHTGSRPYKCAFCPSSFAQNSNLKIHLRSHTGEKPFRCTFCNLAFTRNASLKDHFRRVHRW